MEIFMNSEAWIALLTLTLLEVVLGIDNIIFISILTNKLPVETRGKARVFGIALALVLRVVMLLGITWIIGFTQPIFDIWGHTFTGRDLILIGGGLFLLAKSTTEIHHKIDGPGREGEKEKLKKVGKNFMSIIIQIGLLDIVFSFDSILTAIGMTDELLIMIIAVVISLIVMLVFAGKIAAFIEKHPTLQILALSFLILIGVVLIAEGFHQHISKGYIYAAVAFSLVVEVINLKVRASHSTHPKVDK